MRQATAPDRIAKLVLEALTETGAPIHVDVNVQA